MEQRKNIAIYHLILNNLQESWLLFFPEVFFLSNLCFKKLKFEDKVKFWWGGCNHSTPLYRWLKARPYVHNCVDPKTEMWAGASTTDHVSQGRKYCPKCVSDFHIQCKLKTKFHVAKFIIFPSHQIVQPLSFLWNVDYISSESLTQVLMLRLHHHTDPTPTPTALSSMWSGPGLLTTEWALESSLDRSLKNKLWDSTQELWEARKAPFPTSSWAMLLLLTAQEPHFKNDSKQQNNSKFFFYFFSD